MGLHQDIQAKVRDELDEIFGEIDEEHEFQPDGIRMCHRLKTTDVTTEHISKMKYLEMVIKETLRLTPTVPFMARNMNEDVMVGLCHFCKLEWPFG